MSEILNSKAEDIIRDVEFYQRVRSNVGHEQKLRRYFSEIRDTVSHSKNSVAYPKMSFDDKQILLATNDYDYRMLILNAIIEKLDSEISGNRDDLDEIIRKLNKRGN